MQSKILGKLRKTVLKDYFGFFIYMKGYIYSLENNSITNIPILKSEFEEQEYEIEIKWV